MSAVTPPTMAPGRAQCSSELPTPPSRAGPFLPGRMANPHRSHHSTSLLVKNKTNIAFLTLSSLLFVFYNFRVILL